MAHGEVGLDTVLIPTDKLADAMGWETRKMRRWILREGAAVRYGHRYFISRGRFRLSFPDIADEVFARLERDTCIYCGATK